MTDFEIQRCGRKSQCDFEIQRLYEALDIAYLKGLADGRDRERARIRKAILQVMLAAAPKPGDE